MKRSLIASLGLVLPAIVLAMNNDDLLQPLIKSGQIDLAVDDVVLLPIGDKISSLISMSNSPDKGSDIGYCLGISQAQFTFWSRVDFNPTGARDSDEEIYKKLTKALSSDQWDPQTFNGFHDEDELMRDKGDILRRVIQEFQAKHKVAVHDDRTSSIVPGNPHETQSRESLTANIQAASDLASGLQSRLQKKLPTELAVFKEVNGKMTDDPGHALTVVGYVKKKSATEPDRILVIDPNFPRDGNHPPVLKVLRKEGAHWVYDLPKFPGGPIESTRVLASIVKPRNPEIAKKQDEKLSEYFSRAPHISSACQRKPAIEEIFSAARR